jgi:sec-independent protein translocase protein TatA
MGLDNPLHIAFLVVILLLVFGARRLPEIGRSLGSGMREFKQSITGETTPQQPALNAPPQQQQQAPAQAPVAQAPVAPAPVAPAPVAQPAATQPAATQPVPSQVAGAERQQHS